MSAHLGKLITDDEKDAAIAVGKLPAAVGERVEARARELDQATLSLLLHEGALHLFSDLRSRVIASSFSGAAPEAPSREACVLAQIYGVAADEQGRRNPSPKAADDAQGPYSRALQESLSGVEGLTYQEALRQAPTPDVPLQEPRAEHKTFKGGKIQIDVPLRGQALESFLANATGTERISMPVAELNRLMRKTQEAYDIVTAVKAHMVKYAPTCRRGIPLLPFGSFVLFDEGKEPPPPEPTCDRFAVRRYVRPAGYRRKIMERTSELRCEEHDPGDGWEGPTETQYAQLVALVRVFEATLTPEERMSVITWETP
jgi:hypothetical protein